MPLVPVTAKDIDASIKRNVGGRMKELEAAMKSAGPGMKVLLQEVQALKKLVIALHKKVDALS